MQQSCFDGTASLAFQRIDSILAKVTLAVNVVMVIAKIFAAYISNSLSVLSTVVDSCMDITSGAFIWYALRSIGNVDKEKYPIGKGRYVESELHGGTTGSI